LKGYLSCPSFIENRFTVLEWRNIDNYQPFLNLPAGFPGDKEEFKRELYSLEFWIWKPNYRGEAGIILEGKYWTVKLKTKGKVYESEGTKCFPANWDKFCRAVEKLTGTIFH
jgi:hypothetical protein